MIGLRPRFSSPCRHTVIAGLFVTCLAGSSSASDVVTDKAMLASLLAMQRTSIKSLQVQCRVERLYPGYAKQAPVQTWKLGWNDAGFRIETLTAAADSHAPIDDHWSRVANCVSKTSVTFGGIDYADVSSNPLALGFGGLLPEYNAFLGYFPTRSLTGDVPLLHDPEVMLADPRSCVLPDLQNVRGFDCLVIQLSKSKLDGSTYVDLQGFYAPSLGYAQVRLERLFPDGALQSSWDSFDFVTLGDDLTAIPMRGQFENWLPGGATAAFATVDVDKTAAGAPQISSGDDLDLDLVLPAGTFVRNVDTGATVTLEQPKSYGLLATSAPTGSSPVLALAALAGSAGLGALLVSRGSKRRRSGVHTRPSHP